MPPDAFSDKETAMKVVLTDYEYKSVETERGIIEGAGHTLYTFQKKTEEELLSVVKDADAVITQYADINERVIAAMERCRVIVRYGIGFNNVDVDAAAKKGIYVCNVPDYGVEEVSDHAVMLMLALAKKLPVYSHAVKNGDWGYTSVIPLRRFCTSTVGLIGFGRIPQLVAKKLSGWGVRLLAYDPWGSPDAAAALNTTLTDLETIWREADFISVHCPLTKDTQGMIDLAAMKKMKNTAFLINTARGGVIREDDLLTALQTGQIAGAGLDVFEKEPLDRDDPLLNLPQVLVTPHSAWYSETAIAALQQKAAEEVVNVLGGNAPLHCVNLRQLRQGGAV